MTTEMAEDRKHWHVMIQAGTLRRGGKVRRKKKLLCVGVPGHSMFTSQHLLSRVTPDNRLASNVSVSRLSNEDDRLPDALLTNRDTVTTTPDDDLSVEGAATERGSSNVLFTS